MHHISKVAIEGFWDTHNIELHLFPEVTFLIGQNGTGKTTLINLLAAALTADFPTLDRIAFKKLSIHLSGIGNADAPKITVTKSKKQKRPFGLIEYVIKADQNSTEIKYSLEDIEEQLVMRRFGADPTRYIRDYYRPMSSGLIANLQQLVHVNWLSVHRAPAIDRSRDERSLESSVDLRLESLSNDLVRFFATLSRQKDDEVRDFQESIFTSLLEPKADVMDVFDTKRLEQLQEFRAALVSIFSELHVAQEDKEALISSFMSRVEALRKTAKLRGGVVKLSADDLVVLFDLRRVADVVDRWNKLQERLASVFSQRDKWLKLTNDLLQRKKMELTASNELQFLSRTGKILTTQMLSSGEKQLLILLSETLLQREQPAIFIADEPELSLHVLWQEKLVSSLRALNPSAQIIAATHSPDIVGPLADHAIDMETLIP